MSSPELQNCKAFSFTLLALVLTSSASLGQTNLGVSVRHGPSFNGSGRIEGSVQQMLGEAVNFNSGFTLTGDMFLPGTPTVVTNGSASIGGIIVGTGSSTPAAYHILLNSRASIRYLRTRINAVALPVVPAPPTPAGTRSVIINSPGESYGDPATLRNLTLNGNVGLVYVPPGTYGTFMANAGNGFTLGIAGTNTTYNLQNFTLNGATKLLLNGPVVLKIANGFNANGVLGMTNSPLWLQLQLANGGVNINSGSAIYGSVTAPAGAVTINGNSLLAGSVASDRLTINNNGRIVVGGGVAANQPPVANAQSISPVEDSSTNITLTAADPEGNPLTYTLLTLPTLGTIHGTAPDLYYIPNANAFGADSFTFKVNDGAQDSPVATVFISITPVNDAPIAQPQQLSTAEETVAPVTLVGTDVEGSDLTYSIVISPQHGFIEGTPPNLTYLPDNNFNGADSFTFRVSDGSLNSVSASVNISVVAINDRPVADAQTVSANEDEARSVVLTGSDPEFDSLSYAITTSPSHGTLSGTPPNVTYLPATNFFGEDNFSFTVNDGTTVSAPTNVLIHVLPVNDSPVGEASSIILPEDTATNLVLVASDVDNVALGYSIVQPPAHGTVSLSASNVIYSPAANYSGSDLFTFEVFDGSLTSSVVTVNLTVTPVNDAPIAIDQGVTTDEDTPLGILLTGGDTEGDELTFDVETTPLHGTLAGVAPHLVYTPSNNYAGSDSFSFRARDAGATSALATIIIDVAAVNDAPVIAAPFLVFAVEDEAFPFNQANLVSVADLDAGTATLAVALSVTNGILHLSTTNGLSFVTGGNNSGALIISGTLADLNFALASLEYLPNTNFYGSDTLSLVVSDGGNSGTGGPRESTHNIAIAVANGNEAPSVDAGQNQLLILPDTAILHGWVFDDGLPIDAPVTTSWVKLSGPGEVIFSNPTATNTTVGFGAPGNYLLRLWVNDAELTNYSDVTIVVKSEGMNAAPIVNAGADATVGLTNALALMAFADDDGLPRHSTLSVAWSLISGPGSVTFASATNASTTATFDQLGTYVLRLTATDSLLSATDEVSVTVFPFNQPPVVDAGPDQSITIPDPAVLAGSSNGTWSLALSLLTVDTWNPSISQPGLSLVHNQVGANTPYVERGGLSVSGTNLYVSGIFYDAGGLRLWTLARWDGAHWSGVRDVNPPFSAAGPTIAGFAPNDSTGRVQQHAARGDELFVLGNRLRDFDGDGHLDSMARFTGTTWLRWGPLREQQGITRAVAASPSGIYFGTKMNVQATNGCTSCTLVPGLPVSHGIARWDGTNWHLLGDGISGEVASIAVATNGDVYVGGRFMNNVADGIANSIAKWNGTNWTRLGAGVTGCVGGDCQTEVSALAFAPDGSLFAAGNFTTAGGLPATNIARWDGSNWSPVGGGVNNSVYALAFSGRDLYVGGAFNRAGGRPVNRIAKWNGQFWTPLGTGTTNGIIGFSGDLNGGAVHSLVAVTNGIYVGGGDFKAGTANATNIVLWEFSRPPSRGVVLDGRVSDDGLPPNSMLSMAWTKVSGPGQVTFEEAHSASTTATFDQLGTYVLRLTAEDSDLADFDEVTVIVQGNQPPVVNAGQDQVIDLSAIPFLEGTVTDDGFPPGAEVAHVWSVVTAPGNVTFGNVAVTNTSVQFSGAGTYYLRLTANDSHFTSYDEVVVTVLSSANSAPSATLAASLTSVTVGQLTTLSALPRFDDGRPFGVTNILWSQVSGPAPMRFFNPTSAVCQAMMTVPGTYRVRLDINDGELTFSSESDLTATAGTAPASDGNLPPVVNAGPNLSAIAFQETPLHGGVNDDGQPFGTLFSVWSAVSAPVNGKVYFANAAAAETAAQFYVPGTYVLRLIASDGRASASDDVIVTVVAPTNEAPLVVAGPDLEVVRPAPALLEAAFFDDALPGVSGKSFAWSLASGPGAVSFTPVSGNVSGGLVTASATFSSTGVYVLRVTVSDSLLTDIDTVTVTVLPGTNSPPLVNAGPDQLVAMSAPAVLHTEVSDDGLDVGLLNVSWSKVSGPGGAAFSTLNGIYRTSFDTPGTYVLRLTASDYSLTNSDDVAFTVYDVPNAPDVVILSPADSQAVTFPSNIIGTASSLILASYVMQYRLAKTENDPDPNPWVVFATGDVSIVNSVLGKFDPTLLLNGIYEIELTATDTIGRIATTNTTVIVDRNMKVGNFTLSFNDLTIPVAGIPIQVIRTYDSRDKREGDFGMGWTLQLKDIRLQKNRHLGKAWDQSTSGGLFPSYFIDTIKPRIVTITFPDNKVYKFGAVLSPTAQFGVPLIYPRMTYVPLQNTRGMLTPVSLNWHSGERVVDDQLVWAGDVPGRADFISWELLLDPPPGPADNILYNPDLFEFTTLEGYKYLISETNGLRSMTDPNGNTLVITTNGITWTNAANSATLTVQFQRDALGRITNILDAMGHAMSYRYDTNGNLVTFTDREGNTNGFSYSPQHQLLAIADARGIEGLRNEFDDSGRLIRHLDANGKQINYAHDLDHRLEFITNRLGFVTLSEYDARGNVVRFTDATGATTLSAYDDNDNLVMVVDPLGRTNSFTYDAKDNRTSVTDALGNITRVTYNDQRRVTSTTDARGNTITNRYDKNGNLLWVRDPVSGVTAFAYGDSGLPVGMTNALGAVTRSEYNEFGRLTNRIDALGHSSQFAYNSAGHVMATTTTRSTSSGIETLTMFNRYDAAGRLTNVVFPDGTQQRTVFDSSGRIDHMVDQLGRVTIFEYDDQGRTTRVIYPDGIAETAGYDAESRVTAKTNRMGFVTRYEYDGMGRLVRTINPDGSSSTNYYNARGQIFAVSDPLGRTAFFGYDALGRVTAVTNSLGHVNQTFFDSAGNLAATLDPAGRMTEFFYDALNRRTNTVFADGTRQITFYDPMGRRSAEQDAAGRITHFGYDDLGRLVSVTNALGEVTRTEFNELGRVVAQVDALERRTTFEHDMLGRVVRTVFANGTFQRTFYDVLGRRTAETDATANTTWFGYDTVGRLVAVTNSLGYVTRCEYDDLGRQTAQIDARNHRTAFEYDSLDRRTKRTLPGGEVENYFYDFVGNLTNRTDFNGYATKFIYDELNRLVAKVPDARRAEPVVGFAYNELGVRTNMIDTSGVTAYRYDNRNRLIEKTTPQGTLFYSYDTVGSVTNIRSSNPNGANISYAYDELHRLQEVNDPHAGRTPYTYDAVGNLRSFVHANGVLNHFDYDSMNRLTNLSASAGLTIIANHRYAVNPVGFRISATETLGGGILGNPGTTVSRTYGYDPLYRLTNETISVSSQYTALDYSYDAVGNRLSLHSTLGVIPSAVYSYTANDRLNSDAYDNNGNTIGAELCDPFSGVSYGVSDSYDFENRLIRRVENGKTISFVYDGDGNRVKKTVTTVTNVVTTWFLVDTVNPTGYAQVLEEITHNAEDPHFAQAAVSGVYTYGHTLLSQQQFVQGGWQLSFYGQDGHNSVRYLTDNNGFVTDSYNYDAFGNLIARNGTTPNRFLFTSEHYDSDLNLYYLRARYHDPQRGRFWSMDSFEGYATDPSSLHKYTYCANNPANAFDPSGNEMFLAGSVHTVALGLVARTTLYSTLGFITGTVAGGYDAIWNGRIRDEQIGAAMRDGGREGAIAGAFYGATSWYGGPVVRAGWGMIGLMYGAAGALGAAESYANGYNRGGTFRLALGALSALGGAFELYATMNSYYASISPPGDRTRQAFINFKDAVDAGQASMAEEPAIVKIYMERLVIEQEVHVPPGSVPVRVLSGNPGRIAVVGRAMAKVRSYVAALRAKGLDVEIFDGDMISKAAQEEFALLKEEAKANTPDGRMTAAQIRGTRMFQENRAWAEKLRREGYTVLDLGDEPGVSPSPFYEVEGLEIFGD